MRKSIEGLSIQPEKALVDGNQVPPFLRMPCQAIVKGDAKEACISAASILAKCARDRFMVEMDLLYPEYGFASHFGYGTPEHLEAIRNHGPCPIHRMSFSPLKPELQLCLTLDN
jgi:ribonuclease HII